MLDVLEIQLLLGHSLQHPKVSFRPCSILATPVEPAGRIWSLPAMLFLHQTLWKGRTLKSSPWGSHSMESLPCTLICHSFPPSCSPVARGQREDPQNPKSGVSTAFPQKGSPEACAGRGCCSFPASIISQGSLAAALSCVLLKARHQDTATPVNGTAWE